MTGSSPPPAPPILWGGEGSRPPGGQWASRAARRAGSVLPPGIGGAGGGRPVRRHPASTFPILALLIALLVAACGQPDSSGSGKAPWPGPFTATRPTPTPVAPVSFPRDEAPHDALTEWWYYTGHLRAADGAEYGFESVVFQSRRADFPPF